MKARLSTRMPYNASGCPISASKGLTHTNPAGTCPNATEAQRIDIKGKYLGKTWDGWDQYEVNQLALDLPAKKEKRK